MNKLVQNFKTNINSTIWRYYVFSFLWHLSFFAAVLVPFFTEWGRISLFQAQILQSWFMLWFFLLEIPTGAIADYFGRKYSLTIGMLIVTLGALIYGSFPRFEIFLLGEFLFAMAMALVSGADQALLYDSLKEAGRESESKKIFGRANTVRLLGMLVSAPIGSLIADRFAINTPMQLSAFSFLAAALVAWTIREPVIHQAKSESKRYLEIVKNGFIFLKNHRTLQILAIDSLVVASAAYFVLWLYQPLLRSVGVAIFYLGFFHAILLVAEILISSNFERLEKFFGSGEKFIKAGSVITGVCFLVTAAFPNVYTIFLFIILAGGFGLTRLELISAYMNKFIPSAQRATIISSLSMFRRFALVVLNPLVGFVADRSLPLALLVVGLLPILVFFFSPIKQTMLEEMG